MIKLSRTGITTLKRMYKSVLLKCLLINAGILLAAGVANAEVTINTAGLTVDTSTGATNQAVDGTATISGLGSMATEDKDNYQTKISDTNQIAISNVNGLQSALDGKQATIDSGHKLSSDLVSGLGTMAAESKDDYQTKITDSNQIAISNVNGLQDALDGKVGAATAFARDTDYSTSLDYELADWASTNSGKAATATDLSTALAGKQNVLSAGGTSGITIAPSTTNDETYIYISEGGVGSWQLADGGVATADLADGAVNSAKIADGTIIEDDLADAVKYNLLTHVATSNGLTVTAGADVSNPAKIELNLESGKGLQETANGLGIKLNNSADDKYNSGLQTTASGLSVKTTNGLETTDAGLGVKAKTDGGLAVNSDGVSVRTGGTTTLDSGIVKVKYGSQFTEDGNGLKLNTGAVNTNELAADAVTSAKIENGTIVEEDLHDGAVTSAKIANGTIIAEDLHNDAVTTDKIAANAVTFGKLATSAYDATGEAITNGTADKLATATGVKAAAQDATFTKADSGNVDLTANSTIRQAIIDLDTSKASLGHDNTFTGANIFKSDAGIVIQNATTPAAAATLQAKVEDGHNILNISGVEAVYSAAEFRSTAGFAVDNGAGKEYFVADADGITVGNGEKEFFKVNSANGNLTIGDGTNNNFTVAGATGDTAIKGNLAINGDKFTVNAENGNTAIAGTLGVTGAATLNDTLTVAKLTTLDGEEGFKFDNADAVAKSINTAGLARSADGDATALATTASVKATVNAQAEDAVYTNSITEGSNITDATLNLALANLDTEIGADSAYASTNNGVAGTATVKANINAINAKLGNVADVTVNGYAAPEAPDPDTRTLTGAVSKLNTNMQTVLGAMYKDDGSYTKFAATNGFKDGADLTAQLSDYAANVRTATGGTFDEEGAWTATVSAASANKYEYTPSANLMDAISQVAGNVGLADQLKATDKEGTDKDGVNGVTKDKTVNQNLTALNNTIGDLEGLNEFDDANSQGNAMTNGTGVAPTTVVEALNNIDLTLGSIHGLANKLGADYKGNLAEGTTVEQHLTALDAAIGDRSQFATGRYTATSESVADATMALDRGLGDLADEVRDFKKEYKSGMAQMAAMSALVPNARAHGNTQISVGTGAYQGQTAAAVGAFHWVNDNLLLNAGVSYGNSNNVAYRAGLTWSW